MAEIACLARYFNLYTEEAQFAKENNFDFMQLWYDNGGFYVNKLRDEKAENISDIDFPSIIHAVLDINDYETHLTRINQIMEKLGHKDLIIHPVCESEEVTDKTMAKLNEKIKKTLSYFGDEVTVYLENNSKLDPIFQSKEEIEYIFNENPKLEFLLDIAHINSYEHLEDLVNIKYPKILHIADKHFSVVHEHLPLGKGELDFNLIFDKYLKEFDGKIILEVFQSDEDIINSKKIIDEILGK